jgi:hypothetical protein
MDILSQISETADDEVVILVLDADCVWLASGDCLFSEIAHHGLLSYETGYPPNEDINGLTRREVGEICSLLDSSISYVDPPSAGGELMGLTGKYSRILASDLPELWNQMLRQYANGEKRFLTEEHWLSYLYLKNGASIGNANVFIRRIWTGIPPRTRDAKSTDFDLVIWHLPAEKRYGLTRLFQDVITPRSRFWTTPLGKEFGRYLGNYLGVPRRTPLKSVLDLKDAIVWKMGSRIPAMAKP